MSPEEAVRHARGILRGADHEAPSFAARQIVAHVLKTDTTGLLLRDALLTQAEADRVAALAATVAEGTPLWRALGHRPFHGLDLALNADTLEPRDDTETLVDAALACVPDRAAHLRLADLGTGTGAVGLALLSELPNAVAVLTDISAEALTMAARNATAHGFIDRVEAREADWLEALEGRFDLIVSNPPYIESRTVDCLEPSVRDHDPRRALDGGADGLDAYRTILAGAADHLSPDGFLVLEIGYDQRASVSRLAAGNGWHAAGCHHDGGGRDRVLVFHR